MRVDVESLINLVGNGILILIVEFYYWCIEKKGAKANKYLYEEELKDSIFNFVDKMKTLIVLWIFLGFVNGRYSWWEMPILKKWIIFLASVLAFFLIEGIWTLERKKHNVSFDDRVPESLKKLLYIYELDEEWKRFFLSEKSVPLVTAGKLLKGAYLFWFELFYDFPKLLGFSVSLAIYPVFLLIILGKINSFFNAYTSEQYYEKVLHKNGQRVKNPRIVIVSDKVVRQLKKFKLSVECEYRNEEEEVANEAENNAYEYDLLKNFLKDRNRGEYKEEYLFNPTVNILKKQNVIFNTFFYHDLELAVLFPMMLAAFKEKKSLIIMEDPDYKEEKKWVESNIEKMCGIYDYISCNGLKDADLCDDIIIVTYQEFVNWNEDKLLKQIAGQIELMFLVEPSSRGMQDLEEIGKFKAFSESSGDSINIVVSDSQQEIAERLILIANEETIYKGPYYWMPKQYSVIVWDADSKENQEFGSKDIEVNIIHTLKKKIDKGDIFWINQKTCPSVDWWWYYEKNSGQVDRIDIKHMETGRELKASREAYYIIEDGEYNFLRVKERFLSRAEEKGFVCIISPNYLLRNYLVQNKNIKDSIKNSIKDMIISESLITKRNAVINIIKKLYLNDYVKIEDVWNGLETAETDKENLEKLIRFYFPNLNIELEEINKSEGKKYQIKEKESLKEFIQQDIELAIWKEKEVLNEKLGVCYHTVFQKYLPGQNIILNGKQYVILNIGFEEGQYRIKVKRKLNKGEQRDYYRQIRRYTLEYKENLKLYPAGGKQIYNVCWEWKQLDISSVTLGYVKMPRFNDFSKGIYTSAQGIDVREYQNKEVLKLYIPGADAVIHMYFAIILREILYTLCPKDINYLGIGIQTDNENELIQEYIDLGIIWQIEMLQEKENCIYILEDSIYDLGILQVLQQKMEYIVNLIVSYIGWYIQSDDDYLLFGVENHRNELYYYLKLLLQKIGYPREQLIQDIEEEKKGSVRTEKDIENRTVISEKEAKSIFSEVLADMFYFRDLNVNIALELRLEKNRKYKLRDKSEKRREKKLQKNREIQQGNDKRKSLGYVTIDRNISQKEFYRRCAFEIIKAYNISIKGELTERDCEQYAKDYVDLIFT